MNIKHALATAALFLPIPAEARGLDIFMGQHWCHCDVNAVHLDGNTSLFVQQPWLPMIDSSPRFMRAWWEKGTVNAGTSVEGEWVVWSVNDSHSDFIDIVESTYEGDTYDFIQIDFAPFAGDKRVGTYYCRTQAGVIPRGPDAPWTFIMVALDISTGQCDYAVRYDGNFEAGEMEPARAYQGSFPWIDATGWWIAGNVTMTQPPSGMDTAEAYLDVSNQYAHDPFINGATALMFATPGGFARGLDFQPAISHFMPVTHNCGVGPKIGVIPTMCNRGNDNAYPVGPEVAPGLNAYLMQVIGTLTTAPTDPCWIPSPVGDGCAGP